MVALVKSTEEAAEWGIVRMLEESDSRASRGTNIR